jgi:hypothetical protein
MQTLVALNQRAVQTQIKQPLIAGLEILAMEDLQTLTIIHRMLLFVILLKHKEKMIIQLAGYPIFTNGHEKGAAPP